jgi:hypothetical protein
MTIVITKQDYQGRAFSESYIQWIQETHSAVKSITEDTILIESESEKECHQALVFIGYAWGQQDNGR